jgi:hypothetical protein
MPRSQARRTSHDGVYLLAHPKSTATSIQPSCQQSAILHVVGRKITDYVLHFVHGWDSVLPLRYHQFLTANNPSTWCSAQQLSIQIFGGAEGWALICDPHFTDERLIFPSTDIFWRTDNHTYWQRAIWTRILNYSGQDEIFLKNRQTWIVTAVVYRLWSSGLWNCGKFSKGHNPVDHDRKFHRHESLI